MTIETNSISISQSIEIKDIVAALAKAQSVMKPAVFNRVNPHFKSRYADFSSCMEACRIPLSENGIAIIQYCETSNGKLNLVTMLAHTSGQWMKSEFPLISSKMDSQGIGSAMTYAKRYSLCGMVGIVADEDGDDDGEAAVGRNESSKQNELKKNVVKQKLDDKQIQTLQSLDNQLDKECKDKIKFWQESTYGTSSLKDLPQEAFTTIQNTYENALKFMKQKQTVNS